jgi:uncharacterized protein (TIGR00255 family)
MTGYGRAESELDGRQFVAEVRSVNHRFAEVVVRMPRDLSPLEDRARRLVSSRVARGRIELHIACRQVDGRARALKVDKGLAMAYHKSLRELQSELNLPGSWGIELIAQLPDVLTVEEPEQDLEGVWPLLEGVIRAATDAMVEMREQEGRALFGDLQGRVKRFEELRAGIAARAPSLVEEYRSKLQKRAEELLAGRPIDENRLALEVALFADRSNIDEELVRLGSHLDQTREVMVQDEQAGRKLEFLLQEINREVNTIASKAGDVAIARAAVEAKSELEKMREQAQNIE